MDNKYDYEQFKKYQKKKKEHLEGPVPYAPYPKEWDHPEPRTWEKTKHPKEVQTEKPKKYEWSTQLQALEDILWAS